MANKSIGNRIKYWIDDPDSKSQSLNIEIYASVEKQKENILMVWLIAWTLIGLSLMYYLFTQDLPDDTTKTVIYVMLGFWVYYEFKMLRVYRWLKWGVEKFVLTDDSFSIITSIAGKGDEDLYEIERRTKFKVRDIDEKSFQYQIENSFWVIGSGSLYFSHGTNDIYFGKKLSENESRKLSKLMNGFAKSF